MRQKFWQKNMRGAASFYIVAFSTLILVIVATSFATVIISSVVRTSNDDLSQSAYDSALAGVEDAKVAYANYRRCKQAGYTAVEPRADSTPVTCGNIVWWMENDNDSCDLVAHILGRIGKNESGEVMVGDTTASSAGNETNMNQAYTCVKIKTVLSDYRANLSESTQTKMVAVSFKDVTLAQHVNAVKVSWYSVRDNEKPYFGNMTGNRVTFMPIKKLETVKPPTIAVSMVQTADTFSLAEFDVTEGSGNSARTNRATMYLVPTNVQSAANSGTYTTHIGTYNAGVGTNIITPAQVAKTNDHMIKNLPFGVYCRANTDEDFMCSATIQLPQPRGGSRSNETFTFLVSLPYEQPDTDFALKFLCNGTVCGGSATEKIGGTAASVAQLSGTQVLIDSTGRANDLYRRVETRLESSDTSFPYQYYALQLLDTNPGNGTVFTKDMTVTRQW